MEELIRSTASWQAGSDLLDIKNKENHPSPAPLFILIITHAS